MPGGDDFDNMICIIHSIDHSIVAYTDTPTVLSPNEFAAARRTWLAS
jgi:hypothetical protein